MRLRNRMLGIFTIVIVLAVGSLAVTLSYNASCSAPAALPAGSESMKGLVAHCYGAPEVLKPVERPVPNDRFQPR